MYIILCGKRISLFFLTKKVNKEKRFCSHRKIILKRICNAFVRREPLCSHGTFRFVLIYRSAQSQKKTQRKRDPEPMLV